MCGHIVCLNPLHFTLPSLLLESKHEGSFSPWRLQMFMGRLEIKLSGKNGFLDNPRETVCTCWKHTCTCTHTHRHVCFHTPIIKQPAYFLGRDSVCYKFNHLPIYLNIEMVFIPVTELPKCYTNITRHQHRLFGSLRSTCTIHYDHSVISF